MADSTVARLNNERLRELQAEGLPRLRWQDVLKVKGDLPADDDAALTEYFRRFAATSDGTCLCCGAKQGGDMVASVLGIARFRWGLAHGEGYCSDCGYPGRAYHYNVGPLKRLEAIFQYHPDELVAKGGR